MNFPSTKYSSPGALFTESPIRDLEAIIRSRTPLIMLESTEEPQIVRMARQIAQRQQLKAFRWTVTDGLQALDPADQPLMSVNKSYEVLNFIKNSSSHSLFVLLDFHPYLQDAVHVRHLKDIALTCSKHYVTVMLVGFTLKMPEELLPFTAQFRLPLPSPDEVRGIVFDVAGEWGAEHGQRDVQTTNKVIDLLVRNLYGLSSTDVRRLARKAINDDGVISESELPEVMRAKYELLGRDGVLSFELDTAKFSEIGGMKRLRHWLEVRKDFSSKKPTPNLIRRAAFFCWACKAAAKASSPRPPPQFFTRHCCASILACFTINITARQNAICAKRLKPPKSCRPVFCGWTKSKRAWPCKTTMTV